MSSENQQNASQQEHKKAKNRLEECMFTLFIGFLAIPVGFIIAIIIYTGEFDFKNLNLLQDKYIIGVLSSLLLPILLIIFLSYRTKTLFFKKSRMLISSNFIFNSLILSLLISACGFNTLIDVTNNRIDHIEEQPIKSINNTETEVEIKETQAILSPTQEEKKEDEVNNQKNIQKIETPPENKDNKPQESNKNNKNTVTTSEGDRFFVNIMSTLMTALLYFLSGYLFLLKGKVEDYLDTIDEQNN
ncbi:hypothetical protein [Mannheimia pernigra]|uniref:Uncharacterized protein n=1 Tax=Mannheimia pernigra TaxID=111844 RepID=A0A7D5HTT5_9PAST|nr:hypothetical protein [Mannheimia pernigra]QLB41172.1 hypothetical protein HV559_10020 [Mannheimia pernigra]